jgi:hypothetical protein
MFRGTLKMNVPTTRSYSPLLLSTSVPKLVASGGDLSESIIAVNNKTLYM